LAQGTRLGYVVTGFLNKETLSDTKINPILVKDADYVAGPNAAYEVTKDKNPASDNQFDKEDSKRQIEISLDEKGIHLTNLALTDHKIKETDDICSKSRTSDTDSTDRESTATYNGSLQLIELFTAREKPINTKPTSHHLKTYKKSDFSSTFLNLTKRTCQMIKFYEGTISVPSVMSILSQRGVLSSIKKI